MTESTEDANLYPVYCPSHLDIHRYPGCIARGHVSLADFQDDPYAEARRRGYIFYSGDVENLRDSATDPLVGDVIGDKRCVVADRFHLAYLREVVGHGDDFVTWRRPGKAPTFAASRKNWRRWAKGAWRCDPKTGEATRAGWRPK